MTASVIERLNLQAAQWNVALVESRETESSLVGFGSCKGNRVVLKITKTIGDEWNSGAVLRAFRGAGTVWALEAAEGAVLLERLDPATELVELVRNGRDEEATAVFGELISTMAHHDPPAGCPTVSDWGLGFDRYVNNGEIPAELVQQAAQIYRKLATSQKQTMLLHGDLHHYNVLLDANRGWVAIDPKGVVGELEYELGAMIRNPFEVPDFYVSLAVVQRRLQQLTDALHLDYDRALGWAFAQAVLSAIWGVEDGFIVTPTHPHLRLAEVIRSLL